MPQWRMSSHMRTLFQEWSVRQEICWYVLKNHVAKESKFTLIFSDDIGSWKFDLWYSETVLQNQHSHVYKGSKELLEDCCDFFILLREKDTNDNNSMITMICCSWRVRDDMGKLQLLLPHKNILQMVSSCYFFFLNSSISFFQIFTYSPLCLLNTLSTNIFS